MSLSDSGQKFTNLEKQPPAEHYDRGLSLVWSCQASRMFLFKPPSVRTKCARKKWSREETNEKCYCFFISSGWFTFVTGFSSLAAVSVMPFLKLIMALPMSHTSTNLWKVFSSKHNKCNHQNYKQLLHSNSKHNISYLKKKNYFAEINCLN